MYINFHTLQIRNVKIPKEVSIPSYCGEKEINVFCVSSVVAFISNLAFCTKYIKSIVYSLISFLRKKTKIIFFQFSHENETYKKIERSPAHCSEPVKSTLPRI